MTMNELWQYPYLIAEINNIQTDIDRLHEKYYATLTGPSLSGMPHGNKYESSEERMACELADLDIKKSRVEAKKKKIDDYIDEINDSFMRQVLTYRCKKHWSWGKIARKIGGNNTSDSVRMAAFRFVK